MAEDQVRYSMIQQVAPQILNESWWWSDWRSQFLVSRVGIPQQVYKEFNDKLCTKSCIDINCGTEVWFSAMFGCTNVFYQGDECKTHEHHLHAKVLREDFRKDSIFDDTVNEDLAWSTIQTTCGKKTFVLSGSTVNGRLICVKHNQPINGETWWRNAIYQLYAESEKPILDNLEWRWEGKREKVEIKPPSWLDVSSEQESNSSYLNVTQDAA